MKDVIWMSLIDLFIYEKSALRKSALCYMLTFPL